MAEPRGPSAGVRVAIGAAIVVAVLGLAWLVRKVVGQPSQPPRTVQTITVIRPPPPPPEEQPPPPPPPEKVEEPLPQDQPEPDQAPDEAPSQQLGLDAEGTAGGDAFGLAARKGGKDLAGSGGAVFAWYTGQIKDQLLDRLSGDNRVRAQKFSITVRVWIAPDGAIREAKLAGSSGNRDLDAALESALRSLGRMKEPPPVEMPQPVTLRVVSRG